MLSELPNSLSLTGAESTAEIIKNWLIDKEGTRSALLGVNDGLQVVSLRTFQHAMTQPALSIGVGEAAQASATGVVAYGIAATGTRPFFDMNIIGSLARSCDALNMTLLDVVCYSPAVPKGWVSARQQDLL